MPNTVGAVTRSWWVEDVQADPHRLQLEALQAVPSLAMCASLAIAWQLSGLALRAGRAVPEARRGRRRRRRRRQERGGAAEPGLHPHAGPVHAAPQVPAAQNEENDCKEGNTKGEERYLKQWKGKSCAKRFDVPGVPNVALRLPTLALARAEKKKKDCLPSRIPTGALYFR